MPEYLAPGVYVEEIPFRSKSIEGVGTSTAGFIGPCGYGSVAGPSLHVASLAEFECFFDAGAALAFATTASPDSTSTTENFLWHAVRAFFAEGGKRLFVSRVFRPLAGDYPPTSPVVDLGGAGTPRWSDGHGRHSSGALNVRARFPGAAGNLIVRLALQPPAPGGPTRATTLTVEVSSADGSRVLGRWNGLSPNPAQTATDAADSIFARFAAELPADEPSRWTPVIFDPPASAGIGAADLLADWFSLDPAAIPGANVTREIRLAGGNDGLLPRAAEYAGTTGAGAGFKTGLAQFEDEDDISIVAAPGATARHADDPSGAEAIADLLVAHAERMRYRIAVLDSPPGADIAGVRQWRARLDSSRAALYYPWVTIKDPNAARDLDLPPSGFIAGIYARTDIQRGVFKAPANEVVTLAVKFEREITLAEQGQLNPLGINCLRFLPGHGYRVWGARTLGSDPDWKYVNLRRYFIYLEHSIDRGIGWVVFEPNGEALWARVRQSIGDFLFLEWRNGAMQGSTPKDAYFVKCDRDTMTQDDLDNGRLICVIGVAAVKPAEFVI
ncbi:MAG TPA: phage tail sheath subtilisin-like domain-containing protein, partial [Casimicrobiaceae bacterium]|nr:phage tail sheath subtilisin-like domain-containing protein [Casimicrobiaceae bacterium]